MPFVISHHNKFQPAIEIASNFWITHAGRKYIMVDQSYMDFEAAYDEPEETVILLYDDFNNVVVFAPEGFKHTLLPKLGVRTFSHCCSVGGAHGPLSSWVGSLVIY